MTGIERLREFLHASRVTMRRLHDVLRRCKALAGVE